MDANLDAALAYLCMASMRRAGTTRWVLACRLAAEALTRAGEMDLAIRAIQCADDAALMRLIADLKRPHAQIAAPEPRTAHEAFSR